MTNKAQCNRHHGKNHLASQTTEPAFPPVPAQPQVQWHQIPPNVPILQVIPVQHIPPLSTPQNSNYFSHNQTGHLGPASLVSLAHFKNRHSAHQIPPQHVYNQILIAQHTCDLTKGQNKRFAHLLKNLHTTYPDLINHPDPSIPPLPTTFPDIRSKFTEGPRSIWKNIPHPPIQTDVRFHSYVKISHVIEDFLAHGFLPLQPSIHHVHDWVGEVAHVPQLVSSLQFAVTKFGQEPFYFIAIKEWQDDYESHYARTENGSVWCKNVTIISEPGTPRHLCTYPIAFSPSKSSHHMVEKKFVEDLKLLAENQNNLFYSSKLGRQIRVFPSLYVSLADQQERRPVTGTTGGNSNFHPRFGYSINYKELLHQMPSCPLCRQYITGKLQEVYNDCFVSNPSSDFTLPACETCYSWLYSLEAYPDVSYSPPDNYPSSELDPNGQLRPFRLSFEKLVEAGWYTSEKITNGSWTEANAYSYLGVHCIAKNVREDIVSRATLQRQIDSVAGTDEHHALQEQIQELHAMDPSALDPWEPPAIWTRGVTLTQHLDVPMHLVFHGIKKGICGLIHQWLKDRRSLSSLKKYYTGLLEPIADMSLDWCKVAPFSGSFAGYLGETYVGLSKISPWFWSGLEQVSQDPEYEPPPTPYDHWNGQQCKKWLQARHISTKDMYATDAKYLVRNLMTQEGGPPPIPPPPGGSIDTVRPMISSLDKLIRILMSSVYPTGGKHVIMLHVLHFLNCFESFKPLSDDRKFPEWLTMYNFLCLLNLPDAIDSLGPLRFNYEGSSEGEGFIALVKPLLSQGMRKNWQKNLALRFYRFRSMKLVLRDAHIFIGSQNEADQMTESAYTKKMFQKYKSWQQVQSHFSTGMPISLVVLRDGFLGAVVNDRDSWMFVPFRLTQFVTSYWGMNYFRTQLFERDPAGVITRTIVNMGKEADFQNFVLLLPKLNENKYTNDEDICWTIVGSEYERLGSNGTLQGVYSLPVALQQEGSITIPLNHEPPGFGYYPSSDNDEEQGLALEDAEVDDSGGWI